MNYPRLALCAATLALLAGCAQPSSAVLSPATQALSSAEPTAAPVDWQRVNADLFAGEAQDAQRLATRAYVWGMPLVAAAQIRGVSTSPGSGQTSPINRFIHRRKLAGPEMQVGVGPNNDTIYSLAWVDLSDGPMVLTAPDFGNRYYTFSINLADSSAQQSLGQRTHGAQLPPLFIHGPDYRGPVPGGMVDVPSHTRYINLAGRILVRGEEEYPLVHALQDKISLVRWEDWQAGRRDTLPPARQGRPLVDAADPAAPEFRFLEMLGNVLRDWAIRPEDAAMIRSLERLGITPERGFDLAAIAPADRAQILAGLAEGQRLVMERSLNLGVQQNGWTTNYIGPRFGSDFLLRAGVAKDQIYVAIPEEAVYPIGRVDADGRLLHGSHTYRIRFAPDQVPPVNAFWSITAYDDRGFMMPNAAKRYSVGDRTPGLVREADGSVTIILSSTPPEQGAAVNWLPVAAGQPFYLMMRLYEPQPIILAQRWTPPLIERVDASGN